MALHPPKNLRHADPRCCLTCLYRENDSDRDPICIRDNQPRSDEPERMVCDRWKSRFFTVHNEVPNAVEWQQIETAPRDGTRFLAVAEAQTGGPFVALWLDRNPPDADESGWHEHWSFDPVIPTHWMPLPATPSNAQDQARPEAPKAL